METIRIKDETELKKFWNEENGRYEIEGNLEVAEILIIGKALWVSGSIRAGGSIEAGWYIEAGGYIRAGGSIEAGGYIFSFVYQIATPRLTTKLLPYWRNYWSEMPPLKEFRDKILDESTCWDELRELIKPKAREICAWDGWHPIIRVQLEMFFGLKKYVTNWKR